VYKALRANGVDAKTAAAGAKNLMNFGKSGTITGPLKALYVFVNPTLQGGHQLIQTLSTKRGQTRAAAYLMAGIALYAMLRAIDGDDDELDKNKMDNISNSMLERHIHVPIGDNKYLKIPIGFGLPQAMWGAAVNVNKFMFGNQSAIDTGAEILKSFSRTIAPVQPSESLISKHPIVWATQTFTPQIAKPLMNVGLDVNMFGQTLTNSKFNRPDVAKALQGRRSTPQEFKDIAVELGRMGFDLYPEEVREIIRGYSVGPFSELIKALIENPNKAELGRKSTSVFIDRFVAVHDTGGLKERLYYRYRDEMNAAAADASLGERLSPRENALANLNVIIKKLEGRANGKMAAATRARKRGFKGDIFQKQAEKIRESAMDKVFATIKSVDEQ